MKNKSLGNTLFAQLKSKHKSPAEAYIEYELSRSCIRYFVHLKHLPIRVREAANIQQRFNTYAQILINQGLNIEDTPWESIILDDGTSTRTFVRKYSAHLNFLGFTEKFTISVLNGNYRKRLAQEAKVTTWATLRKLILVERRNSEFPEQPDVISKLYEISERFGLLFLSIAKHSTYADSTKKLLKSFAQLASVVGCDEAEIGAYQLSFIVGAGAKSDANSYQNFWGTQRIGLRDLKYETAFAHEWAHAIDNILGSNRGAYCYASEDNLAKNSVTDLMKSAISQQLQLDQCTSNQFVERALQNTNRLLRYGKRDETFFDFNFVKNLVFEGIQACQTGEWDKSSFLAKSLPLQRRSEYIAEMIAAELEIIRTIVNNNDSPIQSSIFYHCCEILNDVHNNWKGMSRGYWTDPVELFARAFEGYVDYCLDNKKEKSIITKDCTSWTPIPMETSCYVREWGPVIEVIRSRLKEITAANELFQNPVAVTSCEHIGI